MIRRPLSITLSLIVLLATASAPSQEPVQTIHGTWIATAGHGQTLHGTWSGGALPRQPDIAEGTWTLTRGGETVLQGTWRAEKSRRGWEGQFIARTARGQSMAGSWGADVEHWQGKTFQELLELTLQEEISGWWQIGQQQGNWWLKGSGRGAE